MKRRFIAGFLCVLMVMPFLVFVAYGDNDSTFADNNSALRDRLIMYRDFLTNDPNAGLYGGIVLYAALLDFNNDGVPELLLARQGGNVMLVGSPTVLTSSGHEMHLGFEPLNTRGTSFHMVDGVRVYRFWTVYNRLMRGTNGHFYGVIEQDVHFDSNGRVRAVFQEQVEIAIRERIIGFLDDNGNYFLIGLVQSFLLDTNNLGEDGRVLRIDEVTQELYDEWLNEQLSQRGIELIKEYSMLDKLTSVEEVLADIDRRIVQASISEEGWRLAEEFLMQFPTLFRRPFEQGITFYTLPRYIGEGRFQIGHNHNEWPPSPIISYEVPDYYFKVETELRPDWQGRMAEFSTYVYYNRNGERITDAPWLSGELYAISFYVQDINGNGIPDITVSYNNLIHWWQFGSGSRFIFYDGEWRRDFVPDLSFVGGFRDTEGNAIVLGQGSDNVSFSIARIENNRLVFEFIASYGIWTADNMAWVFSIDDMDYLIVDPQDRLGWPLSLPMTIPRTDITLVSEHVLPPFLPEVATALRQNVIHRLTYGVTARTATANPTTASVLVNGRNINFQAYNINDFNYFRLRDIAYALNGTSAQFSVGWDGAANAITLTRGQPYAAIGGELQGVSAGASNAIPTTSTIYLDGRRIEPTAFNINDSNYFMLRDLGELLNFGVDWDDATRTILITTN